MWLGRRASTGTDWVNRALITLQRVEKSWSPGGRVQTACMWSGNTTQASMRKGRSARVSRTAARSSPMRSTSVCAPRSARATVKNTVAPGTLGRM